MDRRRARYAAGFIVFCWALIAGLWGFFKVLAWIFRKNPDVGILAFLAMIYSCAFGFLGWQAYGLKSMSLKWFGRKKGWGGSGQTRSDEEESGEAGWKR